MIDKIKKNVKLYEAIREIEKENKKKTPMALGIFSLLIAPVQGYLDIHFY